MPVPVKRLARISAVVFACVLAACEVQPIEWPDPADLLDDGQCDHDRECEDIEGAVCFERPDGLHACHVPCYADGDCLEGQRCGELVGETRGRRVCVKNRAMD